MVESAIKLVKGCAVQATWRNASILVRQVLPPFLVTMYFGKTALRSTSEVTTSLTQRKRYLISRICQKDVCQISQSHLKINLERMENHEVFLMNCIRHNLTFGWRNFVICLVRSIKKDSAQQAQQRSRKEKAEFALEVNCNWPRQIHRPDKIISRQKVCFLTLSLNSKSKIRACAQQWNKVLDMSCLFNNHQIHVTTSNRLERVTILQRTYMWREQNWKAAAVFGAQSKTNSINTRDKFTLNKLKLYKSLSVSSPLIT